MSSTPTHIFVVIDDDSTGDYCPYNFDAYATRDEAVAAAADLVAVLNDGGDDTTAYRRAEPDDERIVALWKCGPERVIVRRVPLGVETIVQSEKARA